MGEPGCHNNCALTWHLNSNLNMSEQELWLHKLTQAVLTFTFFRCIFKIITCFDPQSLFYDLWRFCCSWM